MRIICYLRPARLIAAALAMGLPGFSAELSAPHTDNHAIMQTPRYLEDHPSLLRPQPTIEESRERKESRQAYLENLTRNHALAASPRFLEEHPEWLRHPKSDKEASAHAKAMRERLLKIRKNSALAASPRMKEQYPELRFKMEK